MVLLRGDVRFKEMEIKSVLIVWCCYIVNIKKWIVMGSVFGFTWLRWMRKKDEQRWDNAYVDVEGNIVASCIVRGGSCYNNQNNC